MSDIPEGYKRCSRGEACVNPMGSVLPATDEYFHRKNGPKDSRLRAECKACRQLQQRQHYAKNREALLKKKHTHRVNNLEQERTRRRVYYHKNRERNLNYHQQWRDNNRSIVRKYGRLFYRTNRASINWLCCAYRRARVTNSSYTLTLEEWESALSYWNDCCAVCGKQKSRDVAIAADHWIPLSKGGPTSANNIIPLCHTRPGASSLETSCNNTKSNKDPVEWLIWRLGAEKAEEKLAEIEAYFEWVKNQGGG